MIFFSKEWTEGRLSDEFYDSILDLYHKYTDYIFDVGGSNFDFVKKISLNDYTIAEIIKTSDKITLKFQCGMDQKVLDFFGSPDLVGIEIGSELLYFEVIRDEITEMYIMNIIFSDRKYGSITFKDIHVT